jgi:hypothetical protein
VSKKLFGTKIEPSCSYCEYGKVTLDKGAVLCRKKGVVTLSYHCRNFAYDPLKREPSAPDFNLGNLTEYSHNEFIL